MEKATVEFSELCEISGYTTAAEVRSWLERNEVGYFMGKHKKPSTTVKALNAALGLEAVNDQLRKISA